MALVPRCNDCQGSLDDTTRRHANYHWAVLWTCPTCDLHYYCCDRSCSPKSQQRTAFSSDEQLCRHHRRSHKPKKRLYTDVDDDGPFETVNDIAELPHFSHPPKDAFTVFHKQPPTKRFFVELQHHSLHVAVQGVVARSCYLDAQIMPNTACTQISRTDVILFFRIARLVFQLGPKHQHLLGGVLSGFETRYAPPSFADTYLTRSDVPLPTTHKAFMAKLLNQTNKNSLTSIMPVPPTLRLSGQHAYVSTPSLEAYDLGLANSNVDPPYNVKFERLVNSPHGQTLFRRA